MNKQLRSILLVAVLGLIAILVVWQYPFSSQTSLTQVVKQWQPKKNHPANVSFSHDGTMLAVTNTLSKDIHIFSVPEYNLIRTFGKTGEAQHIAFSPDNKTLAIGSNFSRLDENRNSIRLWDIKSAEVLWEPPGFIDGSKNENDVRALAFSPDGRSLLASLVSNHSKDSFHLFLIDMEKKTTKRFSKSYSASIAFSPSGDFVVSAGYDGVHMWTASGERLVWEQPLQDKNKPGWKTPINKVVFSPDGSRLLVSANGIVTIISAADGKINATLPVKPKYETIADFSPNGKYIVVASDQLWILDASSLKVVEEIELPKNAISISFNPNGRFFSVGTYSGYVVAVEFVN